MTRYLTHFKIQQSLYTDGTVLLADNQSNLQNALNCLADYRDDWKLDVNTQKANVENKLDCNFSERKSTFVLFSFILGLREENQ